MDGFFVVHNEEYERLHCHLRAAERQGIQWHARSIAQGIGHEWESQGHIALELSQSKIGLMFSTKKPPLVSRGLAWSWRVRQHAIYVKRQCFFTYKSYHITMYLSMGVGAKTYANQGNVLLIRRCMVSASNAHVIENMKAENSALMKMFHEVGIERACNWNI